MTDAWFGAEPSSMPLGRLLSWSGGAVDRHYRRVVAEHGMTPTAVGVLGVLARSAAVSHRELAAQLGLAPATLTPVVDALESSGDLARARDATDRRIVRLSVTKAGRERLTLVFDQVAGAMRERMPQPPPVHQVIIREYLLAVLAAVEEC